MFNRYCLRCGVPFFSVNPQRVWCKECPANMWAEHEQHIQQIVAEQREKKKKQPKRKAG